MFIIGGVLIFVMNKDFLPKKIVTFIGARKKRKGGGTFMDLFLLALQKNYVICPCVLRDTMLGVGDGLAPIPLNPGPIPPPCIPLSTVLLASTLPLVSFPLWI